MPTQSASGTRGAHGTKATITSPTGEQDARPLSDTHRAPTQNVLVLLLAFRIVNALTLSTFFQPDEYFQSLEPAWQLAFGPSSGAWMTWVWADNVFFFASLTLSDSPRVQAHDVCRNGEPNCGPLCIQRYLQESTTSRQRWPASVTSLQLYARSCLLLHLNSRKRSLQLSWIVTRGDLRRASMDEALAQHGQL
jgi:Alg9-like mannosyltransferase family